MENKKHGEDKILQGRRVMNGSVHKQCIVEINEHRSVVGAVLALEVILHDCLVLRLPGAVRGSAKHVSTVLQEYKLMLYFLPTAQSIGVSRVSGKLTATDYLLY